MLLDEYFGIKKKVFLFFGYTEGWEKLPLHDSRDKFWSLDERAGKLLYANTETELGTGGGYEEKIYFTRYLPKHVYRAGGFTMVCCDTQSDNSRVLRVLDNTKERPC